MYEVLAVPLLHGFAGCSPYGTRAYRNYAKCNEHPATEIDRLGYVTQNKTYAERNYRVHSATKELKNAKKCRSEGEPISWREQTQSINNVSNSSYM